MKSKEFLHFRKKLDKTQKQMAELLGTSIKAVHSYEQGWRSVPTHVERQVLFLHSRKQENIEKFNNCWKVSLTETPVSSGITNFSIITRASGS